MEIDDILKKLPKIEQIFGLLWIIFWFCAIWGYHIQFFLSGLFCLFLALLISGNIERFKSPKAVKAPALLAMDKSTRTLKVQKLYEKGLNWDDLEVCSGSTVLPSGLIKEGDVIKGCQGNVALRHVPSNILFGGYNFED